MAIFRLIRFGDTDLQHYNLVNGIGSGVAPASWSPLPGGGAMNLGGGQTVDPGAREFSYSCRLKAATREALEILYWQLESLRGSEQKLYRRTAGGDVHWIYAQLEEVAAENSFEISRYQLIQDVSLRFTAGDVYWQSGGSRVLKFNSGIKLGQGYHLVSSDTYALTTSPTAITLMVGAAGDTGRATIRAVKYTVSPGAAKMTSLTVQRTSGEQLVYTGDINPGSELVVDGGIPKVTCTGVSGAYKNMTFAAAGSKKCWLTLVPGPNYLQVLWAGGGAGATIIFDFYEAWY